MSARDLQKTAKGNAHRHTHIQQNKTKIHKEEKRKRGKEENRRRGEEEEEERKRKGEEAGET